MTQAELDPKVLVIGPLGGLAPALEEALAREDLHPVIHVSDEQTALTLSHARPPQLIIVDFEWVDMNADALADALQAIVPNSWILDFAGVLRRRPEHAHVQSSVTRPLVITIEKER